MSTVRQVTTHGLETGRRIEALLDLDEDGLRKLIVLAENEKWMGRNRLVAVSGGKEVSP